MVPEERRYTPEHEWVAISGATARIGITAYAQSELGDIVLVTMPEVGARVAAGEAMGEVESTKSMSEIYSPLHGTVIARNDTLEASPELLNADPYDQGWIVELALDGDPADALDQLLDAAAYRALIGE